MKKYINGMIIIILTIFFGVFEVNAVVRKEDVIDNSSGVSDQNVIYDDNNEVQKFTIRVNDMENASFEYEIGDDVTLNDGDFITNEDDNSVLIILHSKANRDVNKPIIKMTFSRAESDQSDPVYSIVSLGENFSYTNYYYAFKDDDFGLGVILGNLELFNPSIIGYNKVPVSKPVIQLAYNLLSDKTATSEYPLLIKGTIEVTNNIPIESVTVNGDSELTNNLTYNSQTGDFELRFPNGYNGGIFDETNNPNHIVLEVTMDTTNLSSSFNIVRMKIDNLRYISSSNPNEEISVDNFIKALAYILTDAEVLKRKGDWNGDDKVNLVDLVKYRLYFSGHDEEIDEFKKFPASRMPFIDLNSNDALDFSDLFCLRKKLAGKDINSIDYEIVESGALTSSQHTTRAIDYAMDENNNTELVTIFSGQKSTDGYSISVTNVVFDANGATIYVKETSPAEGAFVGSSIAYPYVKVLFKEIPKSITVLDADTGEEFINNNSNQCQYGKYSDYQGDVSLYTYVLIGGDANSCMPEYTLHYTDEFMETFTAIANNLTKSGGEINQDVHQKLGNIDVTFKNSMGTIHANSNGLPGAKWEIEVRIGQDNFSGDPAITYRLYNCNKTSCSWTTE